MRASDTTHWDINDFEGSMPDLPEASSGILELYPCEKNLINNREIDWKEFSSILPPLPELDPPTGTEESPLGSTPSTPIMPDYKDEKILLSSPPLALERAIDALLTHGSEDLIPCFIPLLETYGEFTATGEFIRFNPNILQSLETFFSKDLQRYLLLRLSIMLGWPIDDINQLIPTPQPISQATYYPH
jgi:hypothetical protein